MAFPSPRRGTQRYNLKLAEKRIRTAKAETDVKVDEVRAAKDALEAELRQLIDVKNTEYQALEDEMAELDTELKELKKKYNVGKPGSTAGVGDLKAASLQIYSLREALREMREELSRVRGQAAVEALRALPPLPVEGLVGPSTVKPVMSIDSRLASLLGELSVATATPVRTTTTSRLFLNQTPTYISNVNGRVCLNHLFRLSMLVVVCCTITRKNRGWFSDSHQS